MSANVVELPRVAKPNIEDALQQFLDDSAPSCKPTKSDRKMVMALFTICINNYGQQSLSPEDSKFFEKHYNMDGAKHKEFCEIFGPDKIGENVSNFVDDFLVRKVMESATFLKKAGTTMKALCDWLQSQGYLEGEEAALATKRSANAAKNLPKAEKAGRLLWEQAQAKFGMPGSNQIDDQSGYMDITKIQPGKLWVTPIGGKELGPITVSEKVTDLLEVGWEINLGLVKQRGKWEIAELGCIYPH